MGPTRGNTSTIALGNGRSASRGSSVKLLVKFQVRDARASSSVEPLTGECAYRVSRSNLNSTLRLRHPYFPRKSFCFLSPRACSYRTTLQLAFGGEDHHFGTVILVLTAEFLKVVPPGEPLCKWLPIDTSIDSLISFHPAVGTNRGIG